MLHLPIWARFAAFRERRSRSGTSAGHLLPAACWGAEIRNDVNMDETAASNRAWRDWAT
jgi:hypothetical protein